MAFSELKKVAGEIGLSDKYLTYFGSYKAKISPAVYETVKGKPDGKYVVLTGMTPYRPGEGRTTVGVALANALKMLGRKTAFTVTQPGLDTMIRYFYSGLGSEKSQIVPKNEILPYLTSDSHKILLANNLIVSILDEYAGKGNYLGIDEYNVGRVIDIPDLNLEKIVTGLGREEGRILREASFGPLDTSEFMNLILLSTSLEDLRARISETGVVFTKKGALIKLSNLKLNEVVMNFIQEAFSPNLVQTDMGVPVLMHGISSGWTGIGNPSVVGDRIALKLFDYVVTESGFGSDLGFEKFLDIKCKRSGSPPDCAVLVVTLDAIKVQSGKLEAKTEKEFSDLLKKPSLSLVSEGMANLEKHIENVKLSGIPFVVALNRRSSDTGSEVELVRKKCLSLGASGFESVEAYEKGAEAAKDLAREVVKASQKSGGYKNIFPDELDFEEKIKAVTEKFYGAANVEFSERALLKKEQIRKFGFDKFQVLLVKTPFSLTQNPEIKGRPRKFTLTVSDLKIQSGAGLIVVIAQETQGV